MNRTSIALALAALCLGAWLAWSLQGSRLRPQIKEAQEEARKARAESDALRSDADWWKARADSLARLAGAHRDTVVIRLPSVYEKERVIWLGADRDSIKRVILWANDRP